MSSNRNQHHNSGLVGAMVAVGATVAVGLGTLAWYAHKKLSRPLVRERPCCDTSDEASGGETSARYTGNRKLLEHLYKYYEEHVDISDISVIRQIVQDVRMEVFDFFKASYPDLPLFDVLCQSDDLEGLHAVKVNDLDLLVVISLNEHDWLLQKSADDLLHYDIRRISQNCDTPSSIIDRCVANGKLSAPRLVDLMMKDFHEKFVISDDSYQASPVKKGLKVSLDVSFSGKSLTFNLIPAVHLGDRLLIVSNSAAVAQKEMWQESFYERELEKLNTLNPKRCCHLQCIQIMKALALDHPTEFQFLDPNVYKKIILHMMGDSPQESVWLHDYFADQFTSVLKMLVFYLVSKNMPHPFVQGVNLLEDASPEACNTLADFVNSRIAEGNIHTLLYGAPQNAQTN